MALRKACRMKQEKSQEPWSTKIVRHVFVDESVRRDGLYRLTAVAVPVSELAVVSRALRSHAPDGATRMHSRLHWLGRRRRRCMASAGEALYAGSKLKRLTSAKIQAIIGESEPIGSGSGPGVLPRIEEPPGFAFSRAEESMVFRCLRVFRPSAEPIQVESVLSRRLSVDWIFWSDGVARLLVRIRSSPFAASRARVGCSS